MELWKLLLVVMVCLGGVVLMVVQFESLYGGDWSNISGAVAASILMVAIMAVIVVVVKHER